VGALALADDDGFAAVRLRELAGAAKRVDGLDLVHPADTLHVLGDDLIGGWHGGRGRRGGERGAAAGRREQHDSPLGVSTGTCSAATYGQTGLGQPGALWPQQTTDATL